MSFITLNRLQNREKLCSKCRQCFLRAGCDDELAGEKSNHYDPSTGNQKLEAWWAHLRRSCLTRWINFFKDLVDRGIFLTGDVLHGECIWFCFAELIEHGLDFVQFHWNTHYIRRSRRETVPGKPEELYYLPENFGASNYLHPVFHEKLDEARLKCKATDFNIDFQEYFNHVLSLLNVSKPSNWKEALSLFSYLIRVAVQELFDSGPQLTETSDLITVNEKVKDKQLIKFSVSL